MTVGGFKWIEKDNLLKIDENVIKNYDKYSDIGYVLEVEVEYPKSLHKLHSDSSFLPQRMQIKKCTNKLACTVQNKENYVIYINSFKTSNRTRINIKKVRRVIESKQETWLKPYIELNTKLRTLAENNFEKDFFKLKDNSVFSKTMENIRNHRDIKLVTTDKQRNKSASEPNYHSTKYNSGDLLIMEIKKVEVKMNKPLLG